MKPLHYLLLLLGALFLSCHLDKLPALESCPTPPVASFSASSTNCAAPCTISLTNNSVSATKFKWNFGDGTEATTRDPNPHLYDQAGSYSISLIASNNSGCSDTVSQVITITAGIPVIAAFTIDQSNNAGVAPCIVKFTNTSTNAISYSWTFGDGQSSNETSPQHSYAIPGNYIVTLKATSSAGDSNEKMTTIKVKTVTFSNAYGTPAEDTGEKVIVNSNGDFILECTTRSNAGGSADEYVVKVDKNGNKIWDKQSLNSNVDFGRNIVPTPNGRFYSLSNATVFELGYNVTKSAIKSIDGNGTIGWPTYFLPAIPFGVPEGRSGLGIDYPTFDNEMVLVTSVSIIKINSSTGIFNIIWEKEYPISIRSFDKTSDNGYILVGSNNNKVQLIKVDANGDINWQKEYSISGNVDYGVFVQQTIDGGYIISGYTKKMNDYGNLLLIKTDASGVMTDHGIYGGNGSEGDGGMKSEVRQTNDGGYIVVCTTNSYGAGAHDIFVVKTDVQLNEMWTHVYGGTDEEYGNSIRQTSDGGYIILGSTKSFGSGDYDVYLIKTDSDGSVY